MFFQLFFGGFRTFRFGRGINRIDDHRFPLFSGREKFIGIGDSFFHKNPFLHPTKRTISFTGSTNENSTMFLLYRR